jgi:hypothetical protein
MRSQRFAKPALPGRPLWREPCVSFTEKEDLERRAAPHCPAGHFSPYSDEEKDTVIDGFANRQFWRDGASTTIIPLLPVTIREEGAGRRMKGSARLDGQCHWQFSPEGC